WLAPSRSNRITAPPNGSPRLSRTVPVIVARPRVPFAGLEVALIATIKAKATSGVLNLKIVFIVAGPPGDRIELRFSRLERKADCQISTFVRFSALSIKMPERAQRLIFPNPNPARARETFTRLNACNSQLRRGSLSRRSRHADRPPKFSQLSNLPDDTY